MTCTCYSLFLLVSGMGYHIIIYLFLYVFIYYKLINFNNYFVKVKIFGFSVWDRHPTLTYNLSVHKIHILASGHLGEQKIKRNTGCGNVVEI